MVSGSKTHTNNSVAVENVFDSPCAYQGRKNKLANSSKLAKLLRNDIFLLLCFGYQPLTFGRPLGFRRIMKKNKKRAFVFYSGKFLNPIFHGYSPDGCGMGQNCCWVCILPLIDSVTENWWPSPRKVAGSKMLLEGTCLFCFWNGEHKNNRKFSRVHISLHLLCLCGYALQAPVWQWRFFCYLVFDVCGFGAPPRPCGALGKTFAILNTPTLFAP